jgi:hypothetical protein
MTSAWVFVTISPPISIGTAALVVAICAMTSILNHRTPEDGQ